MLDFREPHASLPPANPALDGTLAYAGEEAAVRTMALVRWVLIALCMSHLWHWCVEAFAMTARHFRWLGASPTPQSTLEDFFMVGWIALGLAIGVSAIVALIVRWRWAKVLVMASACFEVGVAALRSIASYFDASLSGLTTFDHIYYDAGSASWYFVAMAMVLLCGLPIRR